MKILGVAMLLVACGRSHPLPDGGREVASDAGPTPVDAAPRGCPAPLVAEGERCVGWQPAASFPEDTYELTLVTAGGEIFVRGSGGDYRYDRAADRWEPADAAGASPIEPPPGPLPSRDNPGERFVVGWLHDGSRVLLRNSPYAVEWTAERDASGGGAWMRTVDPEWVEPAVALPVAEDEILFAGFYASARYVIRPR